jgi:hypothetical protein
VVRRLWTARFALLLALLVGWNVLDDIDVACADEDASLIEGCTLCPCCATSMTSTPVVVLAPIATSPEQVTPPQLPLVSLDAPAPPTPPPILS